MSDFLLKAHLDRDFKRVTKTFTLTPHSPYLYSRSIYLLLVNFLKTNLKPQLFLKYHSNQQSQSQISAFDPPKIVHPLLRIATKSTETPKSGVTLLTFSIFTLFTPRYHRIPDMNLNFGSLFKSLATLSPFLQSRPFVV